jgi:ornithine decarboxylase
MLFQSHNLQVPQTLLDRLISTVMALLPVPRETNLPEKVIHTPRNVEYRKSSPDELVDLAIEGNIARIAKRSLVGGDESFFVADIGQVIRQHRRWTQNLPGIRPYYGMKFYRLSAFQPQR